MSATWECTLRKLGRPCPRKTQSDAGIPILQRTKPRHVARDAGSVGGQRAVVRMLGGIKDDDVVSLGDGLGDLEANTIPHAAASPAKSLQAKVADHRLLLVVAQSEPRRVVGTGMVPS